MKGWLIYDKKQYDQNSWFAGKLLDAVTQTEHTLELIIVEGLSYGISLNEINFEYCKRPVEAPDFVINRSIYPFLSEVLEKSGARVFNSSSVSKICNDKRRTHEFFSDCETPMMNTIFLDRRFFNPDTIGITYPKVLKSASGHGGKEVFMIENREQLMNAVNSLADDRFLLQDVCSELGKDLRVYVLGGRILCSMMRISDKDFKSNYSLGGQFEPYQLRRQELSIVEKVSQKLRADFVGIDFIYDKGVPKLNEVEDVVGTKMIYKLGTLDPAALYISYILKNI